MHMSEKLLSKLIQFETLSKNYKENGRALSWVKKQLQGLPLIIQEGKINKFPYLIITTKRTKKPKLLLGAHIDVVGGKPQVFRPKVKNKKLFGRGVFDMKYAIACYIKLFQELGQDLPSYDLGIMLTTDEELGGESGVKALLRKGYKPKICFLPDGGKDWKINIGSKGVIQVLVESRGVSAHGSRPWLGKNAITELTQFLDRLAKQFPQEPCGDKEHNHRTLNVGQITGGLEVNKIPDYASAILDIRFPATDKLSDIKKLLTRITKKFFGLSYKVIALSDAFKLDRKNKYVKKFAEILQKKIKTKIKYASSHGSCDARYFVKTGVPTIIIRPVGGGHHTENEFIDLKSLNQFYEVLKDYVIEAAKKGH
jgi:succinyl-diaminopimelate desuccinylase